jgi:hypothetical protein
MKFLIKKILKEETEHSDVIHIPSFKYFNNDWNFLQEYLESEGNLPYTIDGDLDLRYSEIKSLGNLLSVGGNLNLFETEIKSLGNLRSVGGFIVLDFAKIESLGNIQFVGGDLYLRVTPIARKYSEKEIRQMVNVGGDIYM